MTESEKGNVGRSPHGSVTHVRGGLATRPSRRHRRTSGRSDKEPSPTAHKKPRSNRNRDTKPSGLRGKEPNQDQPQEPTLNRSQELSSSGRRHRGPAIRCNSDWCRTFSIGAAIAIAIPLVPIIPEGAWATLYCGLSVPAILIFGPAYAGGALRSGNIRGAVANDHFGFRVVVDEDPILAFPAGEVDCDVGSIDLNVASVPRLPNTSPVPRPPEAESGACQRHDFRGARFDRRSISP